MRAEILGAFFNAVFLIALCLSIVLEAITRLIDPPEIGSPKLILMVGCMGLLSNLVGFVVLGGHSHGGHSHGEEGGHHHHGAEEDHHHGAEDHHHHHSDKARDAEEGRNHDHSHHAHAVSNEARPAADILSDSVSARVIQFPTGANHRSKFSYSGETASTSYGNEGSVSRSVTRSPRHHRRRTSSIRHSRLSNIDDLIIHPASFRQEIIAISRPVPDGLRDEEISVSDDDVPEDETIVPTETQPLIGKSLSASATKCQSGKHQVDSWHNEHNHNKPKKSAKSGGHNHGDLGLRAMVLHVIGDALGNVGVIVSALIIWLAPWSGRFYADPAVSLFITIIILHSTIPLTLATANILLQATPDHLDVNNIKEDIQDIQGVVSCHHVHIWELSDSQIIASLHIRLSFPSNEVGGGERYMEIAKEVRECLHAYGIHSATIQPEFFLDKTHDHDHDAGLRYDGLSQGVARDGTTCLLECVEDCNGSRCCSPPKSV